MSNTKSLDDRGHTPLQSCFRLFGKLESWQKRKHNGDADLAALPPRCAERLRLSVTRYLTILRGCASIEFSGHLYLCRPLKRTWVGVEFLPRPEGRRYSHAVPDGTPFDHTGGNQGRKGACYSI